jgi:hypothetical protein
MQATISIESKATPSKLVKTVLEFGDSPLARIPFVYDFSKLIAWRFGYIDFDFGSKVRREYLRDNMNLILSFYRWRLELSA